MLGLIKFTHKFRMALLYSYFYEFESTEMTVHFIDYEYDIIRAEQLAQIGHKIRREWASKMINFILKSEINDWTAFDLKLIDKCSFGQRLSDENWENPAVELMHANNRLSLCIYRYYLLFISLFD